MCWHVLGRLDADVVAGETVTLPASQSHRFSNPLGEEAVFINTATHGFFLHYFDYLGDMINEGKTLTLEINSKASQMLRCNGTYIVPPPSPQARNLKAGPSESERG